MTRPDGHIPYRCGGGLDDCSETGCATHHGELFSCIVCGGAEADLPKECPGYGMTEDQRQRVAAGWINFIGGKWVALGKRDADGRVYRESHSGERIYKNA